MVPFIQRECVSVAKTKITRKKETNSSGKERLIKISTMRRRMKALLGKEKIVGRDAIEAVCDLTDAIFYDVIDRVKVKPYRVINGYLVAQETLAHMEARKDIARYNSFLKEMAARLAEFGDAPEKKDVFS